MIPAEQLIATTATHIYGKASLRVLSAKMRARAGMAWMRGYDTGLPSLLITICEQMLSSITTKERTLR